MKTGFEAMRMGSIIYFLPFFFVLNPALIGRGAPGEVVLVVGTALVGILLIAGGMQGYLLGFGRIADRTVRSLIARSLLVGSGIAFALPGNGELRLSHLSLLAVGLGLVALALALAWSRRQTLPA
jgi:TRAP-type uncharacterized transport system fused permease subunit